MTCQPWCADHIDEFDTCTGPDIVLDFGNIGEHPITCRLAVVDLSQSPNSVCSVLHIGDTPVADLDMDQAAAIGWGLLSQVAQATGDTVMAGYYRGRAEGHAAAATVRSTR